MVYITGRPRQPGEINGKSANVNNCLRRVVYHDASCANDIPWWEVIVVFDADMQAKPNFFLRILEVMLEDEVALCLTPQVRARLIFVLLMRAKGEAKSAVLLSVGTAHHAGGGCHVTFSCWARE